MEKKHLLYLIATLLFFTSCNQHIYGPALYKTDINYQFKPMSSDSVKSANYVSGAVELGSGVNLQDEILIGQINYNRANTYKNFNLSYGGSALLAIIRITHSLPRIRGTLPARLLALLV